MKKIRKMLGLILVLSIAVTTMLLGHSQILLK